MPKDKINEKINEETIINQVSRDVKTENQNNISKVTTKTTAQGLSEALKQQIRYEASLPLFVTNEDIISVKANKIEIKLNEDNQLLNEPNKRKIISETNHVINPRNTHSFCFFNEDNSNTLVENDLINATRKYHTRAKYSKVQL